MCAVFNSIQSHHRNICRIRRYVFYANRYPFGDPRNKFNSLNEKNYSFLTEEKKLNRKFNADVHRPIDLEIGWQHARHDL